MPKKQQKYTCPPKRVQIPADIRALGSDFIARAIYSYYQTRPVHLINTGRRVQRKKGKPPRKRRS